MRKNFWRQGLRTLVIIEIIKKSDAKMKESAVYRAVRTAL